MKAVLLLRVSSKEQEENHSLSAQKMRLEEYSTRKEFMDKKTFSVVESSTQGERKQFKEVIQFIKKQKGTTALIIEAVDRLQRSFKESVLLDEMRRKGEVELHFVRENLIIHQNSKASDLFIWDIHVVIAKGYVASLSENVKRSNEKKLRSGEYTQKAPVGYLNYKDTNKRSQIRIDETRAHLVQEAFKLYASGGYSITKITAWLKENGCTNNTKAETPLTKSGVHKMLQHKFYIGIMTVNGIEYPHKYPKIIDDWIFSKCQEVLHRKTQKHKKEETKHEFIFKGLLHNKSTGRLLSGDLKKGKYVYYYSPRYLNSPASERVKEEVILKQIEDVFLSIKIPSIYVAEIKEHLKVTHEAKSSFKAKRVQELRRSADRLDKKMSNLLDLRIDNSISEKQYKTKLNELKKQKSFNTDQLEQLDDADEKFALTVEYILELCSNSCQIFRSSKVPVKRHIIQFVFSNLQLNGQKLVYDLHKPFNDMTETKSRSKWLRLVDTFRTQYYQDILFLYEKLHLLNELPELSSKPHITKVSLPKQSHYPSIIRA